MEDAVNKSRKTKECIVFMTFIYSIVCSPTNAECNSLFPRNSYDLSITRSGVLFCHEILSSCTIFPKPGKPRLT